MSKDDFKVTLEAFSDFIHPDDRQIVQDASDAAIRQNVPYNIEHRIVTQAGVERTVNELGEITFDETGKPVRMIGTVQDITGQKAAETEMRLVKSAIESSVEGILI